MRDAAVKARRGGAHRSTNTRWWQVVSAVVPITLVAGAWGVAIAATPAADTVDATSGNRGGEPGAPVVSDVPSGVFEKPTARTTKKRQSRSAPLAGLDKTKATPASLRSSPLPSAAIDAYRDAATVMADVKASCKLDWTLIAAIGRVESNHGQYGGSTVNSAGNTSPEIIGIPLDGTNNTAAIQDTDNGTLDDDSTWDRAVGPMQFIPSTWDLVAVDANGDGDKDPHNVYDASLATAVYLCADGEDVSTEEGASEAVFSYNHSNDYVATVLAIAEQYGNGNFSEEPSVYLPDTDPEGDVFDPDVDPGTNDDGGSDGSDADTDDGTAKPDKVKSSDFGKPEKSTDGPRRIQPIEKQETSPQIGGGDGDVIEHSTKPVRPEQLPDRLKSHHSQTKPKHKKSGRPTNPRGQTAPDKVHGHSDNHSDKSKDKLGPLKGFSGGGVQDDRGTSVGPGRTESATPNKVSKDPKPRPQKSDPKKDSTQDGGAFLESKPKAETKPKPKVETKPKAESKPKAEAKPKTESKTETQPKAEPMATKPDEGSDNKRPKHRKDDKLGAIDNASDQQDLCASGADELRTQRSGLGDAKTDELVTMCVDNFSEVTSVSSSDPVLNWMTTKVDEL